MLDGDGAAFDGIGENVLRNGRGIERSGGGGKLIGDIGTTGLNVGCSEGARTGVKRDES